MKKKQLIKRIIKEELISILKEVDYGKEFYKTHAALQRDSDDEDGRLDIENVIQEALYNITKHVPQKNLDEFMKLLDKWHIFLNVTMDSTSKDIDSEIKHSDWSSFDEADAEELQQDIDKL